MTRALLAAVLLCLALPAGAAAAEPAQTNAPPGNSAIDEYLETVPASGGNARPRPAQPGQDGAAGGVLSPAERARLEALGADGKTLANAVVTTAPAPAAPAKPTIDVQDSNGRSPFSAVLQSVGEGDGGMGVVLPAILVASLLAACAAVLLRRRTTS